jgi:hypothetical protein
MFLLLPYVEGNQVYIILVFTGTADDTGCLFWYVNWSSDIIKFIKLYCLKEIAIFFKL